MLAGTSRDFWLWMQRLHAATDSRYLVALMFTDSNYLDTNADCISCSMQAAVPHAGHCWPADVITSPSLQYMQSSDVYMPLTQAEAGCSRT